MKNSDEYLHDQLLDLTIIGARYMDKGVTEFSAWSKAMLAVECSISLRPFLRVVYASSKTLLERSKIPPGFHRCQHCGEYNGTTKAKYLCWELPVLDPEEAISVRCLCKGIPCPQCGQGLVHRPISNSYDAKTNSIWHSPWFSGMIPCYECKARERDNLAK
jgi:hypothetical protein